MKGLDQSAKRSSKLMKKDGGRKGVGDKKSPAIRHLLPSLLFSFPTYI